MTYVSCWIKWLSTLMAWKVWSTLRLLLQSQVVSFIGSLVALTFGCEECACCALHLSAIKIGSGVKKICMGIILLAWVGHCFRRGQEGYRHWGSYEVACKLKYLTKLWLHIGLFCLNWRLKFCMLSWKQSEFCFLFT